MENICDDYATNRDMVVAAAILLRAETGWGDP
jgi:hypothetical protein